MSEPTRESLTAEVERLRRWKEEALPVMSGLQELGRALGIGPGQRITGRDAVDAALDLRNERDAALERVRDLEEFSMDLIRDESPVLLPTDYSPATDRPTTPIPPTTARREDTPS